MGGEMAQFTCILQQWISITCVVNVGRRQTKRYSEVDKGIKEREQGAVIIFPADFPWTLFH